RYGGLRSFSPSGGGGRRPLRDSLDAWRHGGSLRRAIPDDDGASDPGVPGDGQLGGLWVGIRSGESAGIRGDARFTWRAGGGRAHVYERISAVRVPADNVPAR